MENKAECRRKGRRLSAFFIPTPRYREDQRKKRGEAELTDFEDEKREKARETVMGIPVQCHLIDAGGQPFLLYKADSCPSSMDLAWDLAEQDRLPLWASVLVETQSAGRGQFNREWVSPKGNVYGSLRVPRLGPGWNELLPLLLAESIHGVLESLGLYPAIKWPNDLLIGGKKVCGILVEERANVVIAGLGLNLISAPQPESLRNPAAVPAGCLAELGVYRAPLDIWPLIVREIQLHHRETLSQGNPQAIIDRLTPHMAYMGERILLDAYDAATQPVLFLGLDTGGGIKVQTNEGERLFRSGSIYPVVETISKRGV